MTNKLANNKMCIERCINIYCFIFNSRTCAVSIHNTVEIFIEAAFKLPDNSPTHAPILFSLHVGVHV